MEVDLVGQAIRSSAGAVRRWKIASTSPDAKAVRASSRQVWTGSP
jgi:hypothetical protein